MTKFVPATWASRLLTGPLAAKAGELNVREKRIANKARYFVIFLKLHRFPVKQTMMSCPFLLPATSECFQKFGDLGLWLNITFRAIGLLFLFFIVFNFLVIGDLWTFMSVELALTNPRLREKPFVHEHQPTPPWA